MKRSIFTLLLCALFVFSFSAVLSFADYEEGNHGNNITNECVVDPNGGGQDASNGCTMNPTNGASGPQAVIEDPEENITGTWDNSNFIETTAVTASGMTNFTSSDANTPGINNNDNNYPPIYSASDGGDDGNGGNSGGGSSTTPEPATLLIMGLGLAGVLRYARRKK